MNEHELAMAAARFAPFFSRSARAANVSPGMASLAESFGAMTQDAGDGSRALIEAAVNAKMARRQAAYQAALKRREARDEWDRRLQEIQGERDFKREDAEARRGQQLEDEQRRHGWDVESEDRSEQRGKPLRAAQIAGASLQNDLLRRQLKQPIDARSEVEKETRGRVDRLEDALLAMDPDDPRTETIRSQIAALRKDANMGPMPASSSAQGDHLTERQAEKLVKRRDLVNQAASMLDEKKPGFLSQLWAPEEPWQETTSVLDAGYWSKARDRAIERAAALMKERPEFTQFGITPAELVDLYRRRYD